MGDIRSAGFYSTVSRSSKFQQEGLFQNTILQQHGQEQEQQQQQQRPRPYYQQQQQQQPQHGQEPYYHHHQQQQQQQQQQHQEEILCVLGADGLYMPVLRDTRPVQSRRTSMQAALGLVWNGSMYVQVDPDTGAATNGAVTKGVVTAMPPSTTLAADPSSMFWDGVQYVEMGTSAPKSPTSDSNRGVAAYTGAYIDLGRAPYALYGVKYIDPASPTWLQTKKTTLNRTEWCRHSRGQQKRRLTWSLVYTKT